MFIGHFGIAFGMKRAAPKLSLGTLFIACQFLDILWPSLLLLNIEKVSILKGLSKPPHLIFTYYPFSHSLIMALFWSCLLGGLYKLWSKDNYSSFLLGLCVFSHWILDFLVHFPDLPVSFGNSIKLGLGLWSSSFWSLFLEGVIFLVGLIYYLKFNKINTIKAGLSLWILVAILLIIHALSFFGSAPKDIISLAISCQFLWVFILLAYYSEYKKKYSKIKGLILNTTFLF